MRQLRVAMAATVMATAACAAPFAAGTSPTPVAPHTGVPSAEQTPREVPSASGQVGEAAGSSPPAPPGPPQASMVGPGCPHTAAERPAFPPDRAVFGKCAYYAGCPKAPPSPPIPQCPSNLDVVTVRELRAEAGRRAPGSRLAVRGRAQWQARLRGIVGLTEPGFIHVGPAPCEVGPAVLYLASEGPGACVFAGAHLTTHAGALGCQGDVTDRCCRSSPAFPELDRVVVAIGTYGGTGALLGGDHFDLFTLESYCYPASSTSSAGGAAR